MNRCRPSQPEVWKSSADRTHFVTVLYRAFERRAYFSHISSFDLLRWLACLEQVVYA